jgi:signal transduction histidine kinase
VTTTTTDPSEAPRGTGGDRSIEDTAGTAGLELRSIVELSHELGARSNVFEIAEVALFSLMGHFGCPRGALWLLSDDLPAEPVLLRAAGVSPSMGRALGTLWGRWMSDSWNPAEPIVVSDVARIATSPATELSQRNHIELVAPITTGERRTGLFALGRRVSGNGFPRRDREVLAAALQFVGARLAAAASIDGAVEQNRRLQEANTRLEELDGLKSEFLRNLNHELRTPLTIITAYLDSVLMIDDPDPTRHDHLAIVRAEATKLEHLLVNLLDFGRLRDDVLDVHLTMGDLAGVVRAWTAERRPGVASGLRELVFVESGDVPMAWFEPRRVLQIVEGLVDNATKFTPPGTRIRISTRRVIGDDGIWACLDVSDDGPGIPPDKLDYLFEAFRQGDGSPTRRHSGLGMGLAFSRLLAQRMNGRLEVETEMGRGTTFSLRLAAV